MAITQTPAPAHRPVSLPVGKDAIETLIALGVHLSNVNTAVPDGDPFVILPTGVHSESLAHLCPPKRITQAVSIVEPGSFVDYVQRFKTEGVTTIFAKVTDSGASLLAILDYHKLGQPAYCAHSALLTMEPTLEWQRWVKANGQAFDQVAFAAWLEDNQDLFQLPGMAGAALLEFIQNLEGHAEVRFNSTVRLQSGKNSLHYDEDIVVHGHASTTQGMIEVPKELVAIIQPFQGVEPYQLKARLRYRVEGRKVSFTMLTPNLHSVVRHCVKAMLAKVTADTGIVPIIGSPTTGNMPSATSQRGIF